MVRRKFTPAQANDTLPFVSRVVDDLLARGRELRQLARRHTEAGVRERMGALEREIRDLVEELHKVGCEYKDFSFDKGLVDFPGELDGRPVLWCWKSDEPKLAWFHAPDAGFAGRARIPAELLQDDAASKP